MSQTFYQIPADVDVMLDANVIVYALFPQVRFYEECRQLFVRGAKEEIRLHVVVNTAADVIHRVMVLEILTKGQFQKSADAVTHLKKNPQSIQNLTRYKTILSDLVKSRINILSLTYRDLHASKQYRDDYGLMTNDSIILAAMKRERIQYLATNDTDFDRIPEVAVRVPG